VNGTGVITNFMGGPAEQFYAGWPRNRDKADARWSGWWGAVRAGPFNTGCLADCFFSSCNCKETPQKLPPPTSA